jgi:diguanylate cyclase (GGDEF)-like protein
MGAHEIAPDRVRRRDERADRMKSTNTGQYGRPGAAGAGTGGLRAGGWSVAVVALLALCGAVFGAAMRTDPEWSWPNGFQLATSYAAVVGSWWAFRRVGGQIVLILAIGSSLWLVADLIGLILAAAGSLDDWSFSFEYVYLVAQTLFAGAAFLSLGASVRYTSARRITDGALIGMVGLFALFTLAPETPADQGAAVHPTLVLLVDGLFLVLAAIARSVAKRGARSGASLLAASALVLFVTDLTFLTAAEGHSALDRWILDLGWAGSSLLRAAAVVMIARSSRSGRHQPDLDEQAIGHSRFLLPFVVALIAVVIAVVPPSGWPAASVVALAVSFGLVAVREVLVSFEQRTLVTTAKDSLDELQRRATTDDLTGLLRRDAVIDRLDAALDSGRGACAVIVDLDGFKAINDTFGHASGDRVLVDVASRLVQSTDDALVGRIGGDELLVVQLGPSGNAPLAELEATVASIFDAPFEVLDGIEIDVSAALGGASAAPGDDEGVDAFLAHADDAAYRRKVGPGSEAQRRARSGGAVHPAAVRKALSSLDDGRIEPWFQPIVDLTTGAVVGVEALARMVDREGRVLPAASFVPHLIAAGRSGALLEQVISRALDAIATTPGLDPSWTISVNLSDRDFLAHRTPGVVAEQLRRSGVAPELLVVEVDQNVIADRSTVETALRLREMGMSIAIDDFGASTSTFAQIAQLEPHYLKLDGGLVLGPRPVGSGTSERRGLIGAITDLAHGLGMAVVADGVETDDQRRALVSAGVDLGQGEAWTAPAPLATVVAWAAGAGMVKAYE